MCKSSNLMGPCHPASPFLLILTETCPWLPVVWLWAGEKCLIILSSLICKLSEIFWGSKNSYALVIIAWKELLMKISATNQSKWQHNKRATNFQIISCSLFVLLPSNLVGHCTAELHWVVTKQNETGTSSSFKSSDRWERDPRCNLGVTAIFKYIPISSQ